MAWTASVAKDRTAGAARTAERISTSTAAPTAQLLWTGHGITLKSSNLRSGGARWNGIIRSGATPSRGMSTSPTSSSPGELAAASSQATGAARYLPTRPGGSPPTLWLSRPTDWPIPTSSAESELPPRPTGHRGSRSPVRSRTCSALAGMQMSTVEPPPQGGSGRVSGMRTASRSAPGSAEATAGGTRSPAFLSQAHKIAEGGWLVIVTGTNARSGHDQ